MTTARVLLHPGAYRILFAMGGVRVIDVRPADHGLVLATLALTRSMLAFVGRLDGVQRVEVVEPTPLN